MAFLAIPDVADRIPPDAMTSFVILSRTPIREEP
jgi:hypothetical protein